MWQLSPAGKNRKVLEQENRLIKQMKGSGASKPYWPKDTIFAYFTQPPIYLGTLLRDHWPTIWILLVIDRVNNHQNQHNPHPHKGPLAQSYWILVMFWAKFGLQNSPFHSFLAP